MLGVADFASKALRFDLNVDRINADRYLPPPSEKPAAKDAKEPPTEIPVEMLRKLNARGQLTVGEAIFAGMKFTKLRLGVNARDGKVRFYPSEASMYGGQYRGDIGIDATGERRARHARRARQRRELRAAVQGPVRDAIASRARAARTSSSPAPAAPPTTS